MLFFHVLLSHNEKNMLHQQVLPADLFMLELHSSGVYYGIIRESAFEKFLDALSVETLSHLEYLNKQEFAAVLAAHAEQRQAFEQKCDPQLRLHYEQFDK